MAFRQTSRRRRAIRYWYLRHKHFTPAEALAFSQLTHKYPALKRLIAERTFQWQAFQAEARAKGWESEWKRFVEWRKWVAKFYARRRFERKRDKDTGLTIETLTNWVVKRDVHGRVYKVPKISPWEWYDDVFQHLPPELKWDSPKAHRTVKQPDVVIDKVKVQRQRQQWIADLRRTIEREPHRRRELEQQIRRLGGRP